MAKIENRLAAVIDIGSTAVRTKIVQVMDDNMYVLDNIESPVGLGHGTFSSGKIDQTDIERCIDILEHDYSLLSSYGIEPENIFTVATTAMREAINKQYIVDRIQVRFGIQVEVLEDGQEAALIFRETLRRVLRVPDLVPSVFLMAYIGTGSLGVALVKNSRIVYSTNITTGSLKLSEMLEEMPETRIKQHMALTEYLNTLTYVLNTNLLGENINAFVATGREVDLITSIARTEKSSDITTIPKESLGELYESINKLAPSELKSIYSLSEEQCEILLPSIGIYNALMALTDAKRIITPKISLTDPLMYQLLFPKKAKALKKEYDGSIIASAKKLAENFKYDKLHADFVSDFSLKIFSKIKRMHGFSRREKLYLNVAGITHDIGKFLGSKKHAENTAMLLCSSCLIDISKREMNIIAGICRYHGMELPDTNHENYKSLNTEDQLIVSKLAAIIRIADALDRSHKQKFSDLQLELSEDRLLIKVNSLTDCTLEKWAFKYKSIFFVEVFGIKCDLLVKGLM